ncbi:MAG TPA: hypothetical protein VE397_10795 [Stellaceae bacterium]|nr:hypothetical protein [Stellaceae bacterium]
MPQFRFTCQRHQRWFLELAAEAGCTDPAKLDELRGKILAWLSARYPRHVLDHFNEGSCLPCKLHAAHVDVAEIVRIVVEHARRLAREQP